MTKRLSSQMLIDLWDLGMRATPAERAIEMLVAGLPVSRDEAESLSVGRRDALLLGLRAEVLGAHFEAVTSCPSCNETVEISFAAGDIRAVPETDATATEADGRIVTWRLPNGGDLRAISSLGDVDKARAVLLERCILTVTGGRDDLPGDVLERVEADMGRADPQAEIRLELACPSCDRDWSTLFDPVEFFFGEICAAAQRLLEDVGSLAAAYGWSERDILAMSPSRRERYLELAT